MLSWVGASFLTWSIWPYFQSIPPTTKSTRSHANGFKNGEITTASLINEEEHDTGEDDEQSVLNAGTDQVDVTSKSSHLEHVGDVVSHDISSIHFLLSAAETSE